MQGVESPDFMRVQYIMLCETLRFFRGICNKFATPYFRAFYGIKLLSTKNGEYTNAVYGFFNIVLKLMDDLSP